MSNGFVAEETRLSCSSRAPTQKEGHYSSGHSSPLPVSKAANVMEHPGARPVGLRALAFRTPLDGSHIVVVLLSADCTCDGQPAFEM